MLFSLVTAVDPTPAPTSTATSTSSPATSTSPEPTGTPSPAAVSGTTASASPSPSASAGVVPFDPAKVEPGWIGLTFFLVMGIAVTLLALSLKRHLGRVDVTRHQRDLEARGGGAVPPRGEVPPGP